MIPHGFVIGFSPHDLINIRFSKLYTTDGIATQIDRIDFGIHEMLKATIFHDIESAIRSLVDIKDQYPEIFVRNVNLFEAVALERKTFNPNDLKIYRIFLCEYNKEVFSVGIQPSTAENVLEEQLSVSKQIYKWRNNSWLTLFTQEYRNSTKST